MKPVFQTIVKSHTSDLPGDCLRASMASLFELDILQVPHFLLYDKQSVGAWFNALWYFLYQFKYDFQGQWMLTPEELKEAVTINGFIEACVPSSFPGSLHSVVIDRAGDIVHDPSPSQCWVGKNIYSIENKADIAVMILKKV